MQNKTLPYETLFHASMKKLSLKITFPLSASIEMSDRGVRPYYSQLGGGPSLYCIALQCSAFILLECINTALQLLH